LSPAVKHLSGFGIKRNFGQKPVTTKRLILTRGVAVLHLAAVVVAVVIVPMISQ